MTVFLISLFVPFLEVAFHLQFDRMLAALCELTGL